MPIVDFRFPWENENDLSESRAIRHLAAQIGALMATVDDLTSVVNQISTDVQTLISNGGGKIDPAQLDPVLSALQGVEQTIQAALNPPA